MKTNLQKFLVITIAIVGFSSLSFSQIRKSDMESMLTQQGTTMSAITKVYVHNIKQFYNDGSSKYIYEEYESLKFSFNESGFLIQGKSVQLFPYSSIRHIGIGETSITLHLL